MGKPMDDEEARQVFREKVQETSKIEFPKIEKLLNHFKTTDGLCPDKICVGDLAILAIHVASVYFQNEEDFKNLIPSAQPLIRRLLQNAHLAAHIEKAHSVRFCPY